MKSIVSEKGQVTIPKRLRDRLGLVPGTELDFDAEDGRLVARKVVDANRLAEVYGIVELDVSTDEFIDELRGPAELP